MQGGSGCGTPRLRKRGPACGETWGCGGQGGRLCARERRSLLGFKERVERGALAIDARGIGAGRPRRESGSVHESPVRLSARAIFCAGLRETGRSDRLTPRCYYLAAKIALRASDVISIGLNEG